MPLERSFQTVIVGAGLMGEWHARYASRSASTIALIVDPDLTRAQQLAAQFPGAAVYATLTEGLRHTGIDVAHICAPSGEHFALSAQALEAGLHVLVEKPTATDAAETERLIALADERGKRFGVALQLPFQQGFRELLQRRRSLGDPARIEFHAATAGGEGLDADGRRRVLWEILPHPLSVFAALFGPAAWETDWHVERFDDQELALSTRQGGANWSILLSLRERPRTLELAYRGSQGRAEVDFYHGYLAVHSGKDTRADKISRPFREAGVELAQAGGNLVRRTLRGESAYPGLSDLITRFHASIEGGPALQSGQELLGIARVCDLARASL